jgi:prepilin-type N-terminal cleavage/methylation domain-containing protein
LNARAGLTLVELVVALAVAAVVLGAGAGYFLTSLPAYRVNGAVRQVTADFRLARAVAVEKGVDVLIQFDPAGGSYVMACDTHPDPPDHQITADDEGIKAVNLGQTYAGVQFTPYAAGAGTSPSGGALPADGVSFEDDLANFNPDGRAVAGSVYLRPAADAGRTRKTERCVTVLGATGRARAYRWTGVGSGWE